MNIYLDPGTVIVAAISAVISIVATFFITWYFSKRHYTREPRPYTITDNDLRAQVNRYNFWATIVLAVAVILLLALIIIASALRNDRSTGVGENPTPAIGAVYSDSNSLQFSKLASF